MVIAAGGIGVWRQRGVFFAIAIFARPLHKFCKYFIEFN